MSHAESFMRHIAIVTGHSRGLGLSLTRQLIEAGWQVLGISRNPATTTETGDPGNRLQQVGLDLSSGTALLAWLSSDQLQRVLQNAQRAMLINNAGRVAPVCPAGRSRAEDLMQSVQLNVSAPLALSDAFLASTGQCKDRRILHISSGAARSPYPGWSTYCATKAALDHHARCVAAENHAGLRIESLAPGVIDTDMQSEIRRVDEDDFPLRQRFVDLKAQGALTPADSAAATILQHVLGDAFGRQTCSDVRALSS